MPLGRVPLAIRVALLCATLAYVVFVAVFGLTPIAWEAAGRPNESYPEIFYIAFGWPSALTLIGVNGALWIRFQRRHRLANYLVWLGVLLTIWLSTLVATVGLFSMTGSSLELPGLVEVIPAFSVCHFHILLLAAAASIVVGVSLLLRASGVPNGSAQIR